MPPVNFHSNTYETLHLYRPPKSCVTWVAWSTCVPWGQGECGHLTLGDTALTWSLGALWNTLEHQKTLRSLGHSCAGGSLVTRTPGSTGTGGRFIRSVTWDTWAGSLPGVCHSRSLLGCTRLRTVNSYTQLQNRRLVVLSIGL